MATKYSQNFWPVYFKHQLSANESKSFVLQFAMYKCIKYGVIYVGVWPAAII